MATPEQSTQQLAPGPGGAASAGPTQIHRVRSEKTYDLTPIHYKYNRPRTSFGRQPLFLEDHSRIHCGLRSHTRFKPFFTLKGALDTSDDTGVPLRSLSTNTARAEYKQFSVLHTEGAWAREVNIRDVDGVERSRKRLQKEESFLNAFPLMTKEADYLARYNNTLRVYDPYFITKRHIYKRDTMPYANVVSVYHCPSKSPRPVSKITFAPDNAGRMAVCYCPEEFDPTFREHSCEAFFWEVDNPTRPEGLVRAGTQITDLRYHPKDVHSICGALFTGQVCNWDNRVGPNPQNISAYEVSHEDVCSTAMWINSKTGCEFFSAGLDGRVIWWDERNLSERLDSTFADPEKGRCEQQFAVPITVLEYENTLPTKFLVGSQFGQVMVFMKKGKTPQDRLINLYKAHKGPVRSLNRNPVFIKNFMSCGDYHLRIFAEDCRDSGIMWTAPTDAMYTSAQWLTGRPCGLVASRVDGCLEFWDLLIHGASSILTTKISDDPLSFAWPSDSGRHVAAGTVYGDIRMVKVCPFMHSFEKNDKSALAACFDRESRREKYLEQRNREIRLAKKQKEGKQRDKAEGREGVKFSFSSYGKKAGKKVPDPWKNANLKVDKKFFQKIAEEKKRQGVNAFPDKKPQPPPEEKKKSEVRMSNPPPPPNTMGFEEDLEEEEEEVNVAPPALVEQTPPAPAEPEEPPTVTVEQPPAEEPVVEPPPVEEMAPPAEEPEEEEGEEDENEE